MYAQEDELSGDNLKHNALNDLKSFLFLFSFFKNVKLIFIPAMILVMLSPFFSMLGAFITGHVVEDGLMKGNYALAMILGGLFILCEILYAGSTFLGRMLTLKGSMLAVLNIRETLFKKLSRLPIGFYDRTPQGRITTRITHDVSEVEQFFVDSFATLVRAAFGVIIASAFMLLSNVKLGLLMILASIPSILFVLFTKKFVRRFNRLRNVASSKLNSSLAENIDGITTIRLFGLESYIKKKYDEGAQELVQAGLLGTKTNAWTEPCITLLTCLPFIVLLSYGGSSVVNGALSVANFIAFFHYTERVMNLIHYLLREIHVIQAAYAGAERLVAFLRSDDESIVLGPDGTLTPEILGDIEFKNVSMKYLKDQEYVLKNFSYHITQGEKIGFVGKTGCGKSTTVSLLSRLYEFQEGEILIDGIDIRKIKRDHLRSVIGMVSQDAFIFKGTLRENLTLGKNISDDLIIEDCVQTGLMKVMDKDLLTLDSELFEGGKNLSTGERQLLSLTRILLSNPKILILDEATANIDREYEAIIQDAIFKVMKGRTCIMIAHRLNTLDRVDRVCHMTNGKS